MSLKLLTKSLAPDKDVFVLLTLSSDRCFKDNTQNVNHTLKLEGFRQLFFFWAWLKLIPLAISYPLCFYLKFLKFLNILGVRKDSSWLMEASHANSLIRLKLDCGGKRTNDQRVVASKTALLHLEIENKNWHIFGYLNVFIKSKSPILFGPTFDYIPTSWLHRVPGCECKVKYVGMM